MEWKQAGWKSSIFIETLYGSSYLQRVPEMSIKSRDIMPVRAEDRFCSVQDFWDWKMRSWVFCHFGRALTVIFLWLKILKWLPQISNECVRNPFYSRIAYTQSRDSKATCHIDVLMILMRIYCFGEANTELFGALFFDAKSIFVHDVRRSKINSNPLLDTSRGCLWSWK